MARPRGKTAGGRFLPRPRRASWATFSVGTRGGTSYQYAASATNPAYFVSLIHKLIEPKSLYVTYDKVNAITGQDELFGTSTAATRGSTGSRPTSRRRARSTRLATRAASSTTRSTAAWRSTSSLRSNRSPAARRRTGSRRRDRGGPGLPADEEASRATWKRHLPERHGVGLHSSRRRATTWTPTRHDTSQREPSPPQWPPSTTGSLPGLLVHPAERPHPGHGRSLGNRRHVFVDYHLTRSSGIRHRPKLHRPPEPE